MAQPYDMMVRVANTSEGYRVTVTLESTSSTLKVSKEKFYTDLNDFSDLRDVAINEFNTKASEMK